MINRLSNTQKLEKELKMNQVLCAFVKTIGVFVLIAGILGILKNFSDETILMIIFVGVFLIVFLEIFAMMYDSCNQSND